MPTTPSSVTWFGSSRTSRHYDKRFNVADGLLPFDPPHPGGARVSRITTGWLARHTPQGPGGRQAALIDIAHTTDRENAPDLAPAPGDDATQTED